MVVWLVGIFFLGGIVCTWAMIRFRNAKSETDRLKRLSEIDRVSARESGKAIGE
jgi:hypothetical protein